jgi:hypothetical protein
MTNPDIADWFSTPTSPLELTSTIQLVDFEEELAMEILPEMDSDSYDLWLSRYALKDLVRPPRFFGSMQSVQITALDEPYARLLDAKQRDLQFGEDGGIPHPTKYGSEAVEHTRAFKLDLTAISGIDRTPGAIETEAWYIPRMSRKRQGSSFSPIRRFVAIPKLYKLDSDGKKLIVPGTNNYRGIDPHRYAIPSSGKYHGPRVGRS